MIYEIRTYRLKTGSLAEVEKRFGEAYEHRRQHSQLAGFFHNVLLTLVAAKRPRKVLAALARREAAWRTQQTFL